MFGEAIIEGNDSVMLFFVVSLFYMKIYMHPAYWIKIEKWYNQTAVWEETEIWYTADETMEQPHLHWLQFIFFESFIFNCNAVQSFSLKLYWFPTNKKIDFWQLHIRCGLPALYTPNIAWS